MASSRKAFLGGAALLGMTGLFSEDAVAAAGAQAVMLTLWAKGKDAGAFDNYYVSTHLPMVKKLPGLISYWRSMGPVTTESSQPSPFQMVSVVGFESMTALTAALESSTGGAIVEGLKNFASGTSVLFFSTASVI
jgi:uncharacterized protein (TIGR02118 family)